MLLTDARRPARTGADGELIPLDKQDRTLWSQSAIAEGVALISDTLSEGAIGPYQLQAAIAAVHDEATRSEDTDWPQILALYGAAETDVGQPDGGAQSRDRGSAWCMDRGPGSSLLKALDGDERLAGHYRIDAVRAHLFEMAGDHAAAIEHYRAAAGRTTSIPERNYLTTQAARLGAAGPRLTALKPGH